LVFALKYHEGASEERVWNNGIAPTLKKTSFAQVF